MEDVIEVPVLHRGVAGDQPAGEIRKGFSLGRLLHADQQARHQHQSHLVAHQGGGLGSEAQAMEHHHQHLIEAVHLGPLGWLQQGLRQGGGHPELVEKHLDATGIAQAPDPHPKGHLQLVDGLEQLVRGERLTPGTFGGKNDQIDVGWRNATVHKEIGGTIGGPLLEQIRGQSARGESQHGGWGSMQRWSTRPVPMIAA